MKCTRIGCESEATGYIDFAFQNRNTARLFWCKKDFDYLFGQVTKMIEEERKNGLLGEHENYAFVPPHMTEKILNLKR
jgi:hypothetical protein